MSAIPIINECDDAPKPSLPQLPSEKPVRGQTYTQILKSSATIGGSSVLNVGIGVVRTKALAVLLGPAGFGLASLYTSIITLVQSVAGMGVNSSGVRQIAGSAASGDGERIATTAAVLRYTSVVLGLLGAAALAFFSKQISVATFHTDRHTSALCLLSLAVLFQLISAGQGALIQGLRRIADLAKMNVVAALSGAAISIPVVYFLRENGVALSLVLAAAMTLVTSWWYAHKIRVTPLSFTAVQIRNETASLLKLGFAFMISGLVVPGVAYFVRVILLQKVGMAAAGMYQSAWTLGGLYVGFVLQAMAADFYPRLSAVAHDDEECNRLVNEQALVGLLLAGPGVLATLTLAPIVTAVFYSTEFGAAVGVLRWICLGATLQVVTWPMGFIIVAKGRQGFFLFSELLWTSVAVAVAWTCVGLGGLSGAGIAYFLSYIFHGILVYPIVRHLSNFQWSAKNLRIGTVFLSLIAMVFGSFSLLPLTLATCLGLVATIASAVYALRVVSTLLPPDCVPALVRRFVSRLSTSWVKKR